MIFKLRKEENDIKMEIKAIWFWSLILQEYDIFSNSSEWP